MLPPRLLDLFRACRADGGRALLVGGTVRDALLGKPGKDLDVEVHGLDVDRVRALLAPFGSVNEVGRAFGVLKLRCEGIELDVSLPRRDVRAGIGHKGIHATSDPNLSIEEAARRRDLTINAIAWDPLTDTYEDPYGGRADLQRGLLRAVDPRTFAEDPLRALRVVQFAARFGFAVDPELERLCAQMPLEELPAERIRGEVEKFLLKGLHLRHGWELARKTGQWQRVLPEWGAFPEALERVAPIPVADPRRRLALLYAAACDRNDEAQTTRILDRLRVHRVGGFPVRRVVLSLVARRDAARRARTDADVRRLGEEGELELLALLVGSTALRADAARLGVLEAPLPVLLTGVELNALGVDNGPEMGRILAALRALQLDGTIACAEDARRAVPSLVAADRSA